MLRSPKGSLKFSLEHSLAACSYWKHDTLHAIVECGSAFEMTPEFKLFIDWILVTSSEKGYRLLSYYVSVLKENMHLTIKLSIRYCKAV